MAPDRKGFENGIVLQTIWFSRLRPKKSTCKMNQRGEAQ